MRSDETPAEAMYRELSEEVGPAAGPGGGDRLHPGWLRYRLPQQYIRHGSTPVCIGQKQVWFLLRCCSGRSRLRRTSPQRPEFDRWCWVDYWYPLRNVVSFKRKVYRQALNELAPLLFPDGVPDACR